MRLEMSVNRLPMAAEVPIEHRGLNEAVIIVAEGDSWRHISLLSDPDGSFRREEISAMLRLLADEIDLKFTETQEAA